MSAFQARALARATRRLVPEFRHQQRALYATSGKLPGGTPGESSEQAMPLGPYYESILITPQPVPEVKPEEPPTSSPKSPRTTARKTPAKKAPASEKPADKAASSTTTTSITSNPALPSTATAQEKARIVFGSTLAGPVERAERLAALRSRSTVVAGIVVPPRPEEPDNCCMSGCVDCVWERYRDEMEGWALASAAAERALLAQKAEKHEQELKKADRPAIAKNLWDDELYKNVPVGIREFMKQEKKLKEKHAREGTFGA
jgi:hypothetical protein